MLKIATHDSGTGEKSLWFCIPLIPFARTQSKTIKEQYEADCRIFDIRCKKVLGKWRIAHGWWFSKVTIDDILNYLNRKPDARVTLTYEGKEKNSKEFLVQTTIWRQKYKNIRYGGIASKYSDNTKGIKVQYVYHYYGDKNWLDAPTQSKFVKLDGSSWHTYIPIPWLWKKIYYNKPEFNEEVYTCVDFL